LTEPKRSDSRLETSIELALVHDKAHTSVDNDPMDSSKAGQEEIEEATPRSKGINKKGKDLHGDEVDIIGDEESEFETPRILRKKHSRVVYSEVDDSEVEAQQQDKGNNSECEKEQVTEATHSLKKVRMAGTP
jgi:hypothetical protein